MTYTTLPMRPKKTGAKKTALLFLLLLLFIAAGLGALWRAWDARRASAPRAFSPRPETAQLPAAPPPAAAHESPKPEPPRSLMPFYGGDEKPRPFAPPPLKPVPQASEPAMRVNRGRDAWTGMCVSIDNGVVNPRGYVLVTIDGDRKRVKTYPAACGKFWGVSLGDASKPHHITADDGSANRFKGEYDGRGCIDWENNGTSMIKCQHVKAVPAGAVLVGVFFNDP
jgi:hypothetical protein